MKDFHEVAVYMLSQEGVSEEVSNLVPDVVWSKLKSKDIRDCMKIGNLAKTKEDVNWIVETLKQYK